MPVTKCVDDYSGYVSYGDWAPAFREANDEAIAGGSGSTVTYGRDRTAYDIRSQIPVGSNGITITLQGLNGAVLHLRAFTGSDLNAISLRPGSTLDSVIVNGHLVSGISGVIVNADAHVTNGCQFAYMDQYGANVGGAGNVDGSVFSYNGLSGILVQSVVSGAYIYGNTSSHNGEDGIDNSAASNSIIRNNVCEYNGQAGHSGDQHGILLMGGSGNDVDGNRCLYSEDHGIVASPAAGYTNEVHNNYVEGNYGIPQLDAPNCNVHDNTIVP